MIIAEYVMTDELITALQAERLEAYYNGINKKNRRS